jgi:hypothetical protein
MGNGSPQSRRRQYMKVKSHNKRTEKANMPGTTRAISRPILPGLESALRQLGVGCSRRGSEAVVGTVQLCPHKLRLQCYGSTASKPQRLDPPEPEDANTL